MRNFCPSAVFDYLGGQLGDKMSDNLQISKLKIKNLLLEILAYLYFVALSNGL